MMVVMVMVTPLMSSLCYGEYAYGMVMANMLMVW